MDKRYAIFDMDGTLVDSMGYWHRLGQDYLESRGVRPTAAQLSPLGPMTMLEGARYCKELFRLPGDPEDMAAEMHAMMDDHYRRDIPLKPGVLDYLASLKDRGARCCVATATAAPLARACLTRLGAAGYFDFLLSCETTGTGKTRPDIYLEAARRFGAAPGDIAVFEDAYYAAKTAADAGFYVVGVFEEAYAPDWEALAALARETVFDWRTAL